MARNRRFDDDPAPWQVLDRRYLVEQPPWLILRQERLGLPNGSEIPAYWISEFPPWVSIVAVTADDHLVLVRQYRPGVAGVHFEIPAGIVEHDEDLEAAARRELLEETGFGGGRWRPLLSVSPNTATHTNVSHTFLAEGVEPAGSISLDETEDLTVHLVPASDIRRLVEDGEMVQGLHIAPLFKYLLDRR